MPDWERKRHPEGLIDLERLAGGIREGGVFADALESGGYGSAMVRLPAGKFLMGVPTPPWVSRDRACEVLMPGRSVLGFGQERLVAACILGEYGPSPVSLAPARHGLRTEVHLPGTGVVLRTTVEAVDLRCPDEGW